MTDLFTINPPIALDQVAIGDHMIGLLRLDQIHPDISGNKWFKLKYNILKAIKEGKRGMLTFGGAYSNHIAATAAAARLSGMSSIGIIRGEESSASNPTLSKASENGMELIFISREKYREKKNLAWENEFPEFRIIPEGGSNRMGVKGAIEIAKYIPDIYPTVVLAVGTGGTMAGLVSSGISSKIIGFPILKNSEYLEAEVQNLLFNTQSTTDYSFCHSYHFGGYAKIKPDLISFMNDFYRDTQIKLDPVYTAKLIYGLKQELDSKRLKGPVLAIHTGGLQGIAGMEDRLDFNFFSQKDH